MPRIPAEGTSFARRSMAAASVLVVAAAGFLTWRRLFVGMDFQDESFYILVPWRWVLGHAPFSEERDAFQIPALLEYPFLKVFGVLTGNDATGLVLYARHLYLLMSLGVAIVVFMLLKQLVRWELALLVASLNVTYIFWATPQLSYNTMAIAFLTLSAALGARAVMLSGIRWAAVASGATLGLAVVAYPSLLFIVPFWAVLLAFAHGRRAVEIIAHGALAPPAPESDASAGRRAWHTLSRWSLGGVLVLVPVGLLLLGYGPQALLASGRSTMTGAKTLHQLGGATKAIDVMEGFWRLLAWRSYLIVAALLLYLVYRRWPRVGRALLAATPVALWLAAQRPLLWASGYTIVFALLAPYLFLFLPGRRRVPGAQLLLCAWAPCTMAGAMTAYTSAAGYVNAAVGLAPAMFVSALFLAWTLETVTPHADDDGLKGDRRPWLALAVMTALVCVTLIFQFQFQQRDVPYGDLSVKLTSGPWRGIKVTEPRAALVRSVESDFATVTRRDDALMVMYDSPGYYLFWDGPIASNSYWLHAGPNDQLPAETVASLRARRIVPTVLLRLLITAGRSQHDLGDATGGLNYPPALVRPTYFFARKPADETADEVLGRLPRP